jgi:hypothetical protein
MAQYDGYRQVPHDSYNAWRTATLGNGFNVDYYSGNQCWDLPALLYFQYGRRLETRPGGYGTAADCWNVSRAVNSQYPFISLTGKENIKRGDILVWNSTSFTATGHIAFADEDYNGTNYLNCLGQNQGQGSSAPSNIANLSLDNFLGIFRNTEWIAPEPPTPSAKKKKGFPWVVAWHHWSNFND